MEDQSFANYQRIMDNTSNKQITIMGMVLAFQAAGYAGIYQVLSDKDGALDEVKLLRGLAVVMFVITGILFFVWHREHHLAEQCIEDLKREKVQSPADDWWTGKTGTMWKAVHLGSLLIWVAVIIFAGCIHEYLVKS